MYIAFHRNNIHYFTSMIPSMSKNSSLVCLLQHMKPLKFSIETSAPILTSVDYNKIFHKLDELRTIHTVFFNDLEARVSHWTDRHLIGDLFLSLVSLLRNCREIIFFVFVFFFLYFKGHWKLPDHI